MTSQKSTGQSGRHYYATAGAPLAIEDVEPTAPKPDEVLVKLASVGVRHTVATTGSTRG